MSLAQILYPSPTPQGIVEWSFHHLAHHQAILDGISSVFGIKTKLYRIWPMDTQNLNDWAYQHQQQHNDFNATLGLGGQDLTVLDYKNQRQMDAFYFSHFSEHQAAAQKLGIPI